MFIYSPNYMACRCICQSVIQPSRLVTWYLEDQVTVCMCIRGLHFFSNQWLWTNAWSVFISRCNSPVCYLFKRSGYWCKYMFAFTTNISGAIYCMLVTTIVNISWTKRKEILLLFCQCKSNVCLHLYKRRKNLNHHSIIQILTSKCIRSHRGLLLLMWHYMT